VNYRVDLYAVLKKLLLLSEVAALSVSMNDDSFLPRNRIRHGSVESLYVEPVDGTSSDKQNVPPATCFERNYAVATSSNENHVERSSKLLEKQLLDLLQEWEEPELRVEDHSVRGIRTPCLTSTT
jgi:hypothetical protein